MLLLMLARHMGWLRLFMPTPVIAFHIFYILYTIRINALTSYSSQIHHYATTPCTSERSHIATVICTTLGDHDGKANVHYPRNQRHPFTHLPSSLACRHQRLLPNRVVVPSHARMRTRPGSRFIVSCAVCLYIAAYSSPRPGI